MELEEKTLERIEVEQIARVIHAANRAFRGVIGEDSGPTWDRAPKELRESVIAGVNAAVYGQEDPESLHHAWFEWHKARGWTHGDVKDEAKKTHPCMVPYTKLPKEQRLKDKLFIAMAQTLWRS
jgi:hypothetical protein